MAAPTPYCKGAAGAMGCLPLRAVVISHRVLAVCWICLWCASCISGSEVVAADVPPERWKESVRLRYVNRDTLLLKDLTLVLRYDPSARGELQGSSFAVEALSPSLARAIDTLTVGSLPPDGGGNNLRELSVPFRGRVRFAEPGEYIFEVTPADEMRGIWSVAIDLTKSE